MEIETDEGICGIGETDLNAWIARACIEAPGTHTMDQGLRSLLLGRDPGDPEAIWQDLYVRTAMTGRRGALVNAIGAIDIALWDIAGKAAGVPTWRLLGEKARESLTPYASLQPEVSSLDAYRASMAEWAARARDLGFHAAKLEATFDGPYAHKGLHGSDDWVVEVARAAREAAGPDMTLMVDVQYAFDSVERALRVAEALRRSTSTSSRRRSGSMTWRTTPSSAALARSHRAGRMADHATRVRRAHRRRVRRRGAAGHRAGRRSQRGAPGRAHGRGP